MPGKDSGHPLGFVLGESAFAFCMWDEQKGIRFLKNLCGAYPIKKGGQER
jgi:hypothetical protein